MRLADILERQIKERNDKARRERGVAKDWSQKRDIKALNKSVGHSYAPKRDRKINETSKQNAMVNLVSPSINIASPGKKCLECKRCYS